MIKTSQNHPMSLKIEVHEQTAIGFALFSDLHLDNPKCRRDLLKKDLDTAMQEDRWMLFNGDTFCLMQGKYDPRRNKSDIRTEHNSSAYIDDVIEETAEFFKPYANRVLWFGSGNHETKILKQVETNVLNRLATTIKEKTGNLVYIGGYHGWIMVRFLMGPAEKRTTPRVGFKIYANHGAGGDSAVTKGSIEHERWNTAVEGADLIWGGHNHNEYHIPTMVHYLDTNPQSDGIPKARVVHNLRTSTYKQEYTDGGWHIETGKRAKPLGFAKLDLKISYPSDRKGTRVMESNINCVVHNEFDLMTPEQIQHKKIYSDEIIRR